MTGAWLTVVMPTYNGQRWLDAALSSVCDQDLTGDLELLLVDDGSTDDTLAIAATYGARLRMTVIRRPHSGNWVSSVNVGLAEVRSPYACILHQDDVWQPNRLQIIRRCLEAHPDADIVLHPASYIDEGGRRVGRWACPLPRSAGLLSRDCVWERLLVQNIVASGAPVFRLSAAQRAGPLDEVLWYTADWDYWLKLTSTGRTVFVPEPVLSVRLHRTSQTMSRAVGDGKLRQQFDIVLQRHLDSWPVAGPQRKRVVARARYSVDVNLALAAGAAGQRLRVVRLLAGLLRLGPHGGCRYIHDSQIVQRVFSRLKASRRVGFNG